MVTVDSPRARRRAARQVWLIDKQIKGMSPMGFLNNGRGEFNIPDSLDLSEFPIVDVSVERRNDPDPTHSGHSVVRGTLSHVGVRHLPQGIAAGRSRLLRGRGCGAPLAGRRRTGGGPGGRGGRGQRERDRAAATPVSPPHADRGGGLRSGTLAHPRRRRGDFRPAAGRLDRRRLHRTAADDHAAGTDVGAGSSPSSESCRTPARLATAAISARPALRPSTGSATVSLPVSSTTIRRRPASTATCGPGT